VSNNKQPRSRIINQLANNESGEYNNDQVKVSNLKKDNLTGRQDAKVYPEENLSQGDGGSKASYGSNR